MGKRNSTFLVLIVASLLISSTIYAQQEEQSLIKILTSVQKKFNVQFNYADDLVDSIKLIPPSNELSLMETLKDLENKTGLVYTVLNSDFILIKAPQSRVLCGFIKNQDNLQPLALATIQTRTSATVSDENGFFQLVISDVNEDISIRYLGYTTIDRPVRSFNLVGCDDIFMNPNYESLNEVLISNFITPGINKVNTGSYEIDFSNFDILPGVIESDVLLAIQAFPGIQSANETVSNINIRGGSHDQNLILWDNIKMYQSGHFFGLISMYNPEITQKVKLIKNGTNAELTDGVSGTISMHTANNISTRFTGNAGVNLIDANVFFDTPIGKNSSLQIAGRKSLSDFIQTPIYNEYFNRIIQDTEVQLNTENIINTDENFDFYDTSLRWIYRLDDNNQIQLNFINVANELVFNENATINGNTETRESSISQNSIAGSLYYKRKWNEKLQTVFEGYETDYKLKAINSNVLESQRFLQENVVSETSLKAKATYKFDNQINLEGGYHFVETKVSNLDDVDVPVYRLLISEVVRTHGVFSQFNYRSPNRQTTINLGLRYTYIDKFSKSIIEPRFNLSHEFLDHFTFELMGEFKHQNTSQIINFQNDFLGVEKRRWQLSNDADIPVIQSKQASVGIHFADQGWLISSEAYYKYVKGITTQSQGFQNQYEFESAVGSYDVLGFEFLLRKKTEFLNTWISYSYMNNQYKFETLESNAFPSNYDITHAIGFGVNYVVDRFKFSAGLNWHSGKPVSEPDEIEPIENDQINFGPTNAQTLSDYLRIDVSAIYGFQISRKTRAELGISIWNVLDRENEINVFYRIFDDQVSENIQRSLGLTPNAKFKVYF